MDVVIGGDLTVKGAFQYNLTGIDITSAQESPAPPPDPS